MATAKKRSASGAGTALTAAFLGRPRVLDELTNEDEVQARIERESVQIKHEVAELFEWIDDGMPVEADKLK